MRSHGPSGTGEDEHHQDEKWRDESVEDRGVVQSTDRVETAEDQRQAQDMEAITTV